MRLQSVLAHEKGRVEVERSVGHANILIETAESSGINILSDSMGEPTFKKGDSGIRGADRSLCYFRKAAGG